MRALNDARAACQPSKCERTTVVAAALSWAGGKLSCGDGPRLRKSGEEATDAGELLRCNESEAVVDVEGRGTGDPAESDPVAARGVRGSIRRKVEDADDGLGSKLRLHVRRERDDAASDHLPEKA